ncbi:MAG: MFS transporter, partial [Gammaproteobacteria bacterium]|nr:MFS transporter [Gammaproteobacteria bacterium]
MSSEDTAGSFVTEFRQALRNPYFLAAFFYFFCLLFSYYLLRPVREEMGILAGIDKLQWLYTGTFVVMVLIIPLFGYLKNVLSRWFLVMGVYVFFALNVLLFYWLFSSDAVSPWTARAFFIWLSVFNMFAVSVFWSLMADVLNPAQAKILFAPISTGGSLGGIAGSWVTSARVETIGIPGLLLLAALLLAIVALVAGWILRRHALETNADSRFHMHREADKTTGSVMAGVTEVLQSGYLARITALGFLYTVVASLLYFIQANLVSEFIADSASRTRFFAQINLAINVLSMVLQFFVTSFLVRRAGVGTTYGLMVAIIFSGIVVLGLWPVIVTLALV